VVVDACEVGTIFRGFDKTYPAHHLRCSYAEH
jgi:hypothetical protein